MLSAIVHIFFILLFVYLAINVFYLLALSIAGRLIKRTPYTRRPDKKRFAVLIPSYREDEVIINTVKQAIAHDYPESAFDVYVAAHQLRADTMDKLRQLKAFVFEVDFETGSKARSLNYLLNRIDGEKYDAALILDGDNIMAPGCMEKINAAFQNGYRAVQCHRTAKNKNTAVALLDALSEEINNHLFRKGARALGLSASLIGSGMAFDLRKLKETYNKPGILGNPACDREVDFEMMKAGIVVEYLENADTLDEKVSSGAVFQNQRTRWLESQWIHLGLFLSGKERVAHKTKDYWNKLFLTLVPPRIIFLAVFCFIFFLLLIGALLKNNFTGISYACWALLFIAYMLCLFIAVPPYFYTRRTAMAILHLPRIIFLFIRAALRAKPARKEFVHTPKTFVGEEDSHKTS
ncbi:MAG: glycosyltransferase [Chitinophagaceae bacterium]|nr:glycosyltransferase [Chitinophagaceae bacterium]